MRHFLLAAFEKRPIYCAIYRCLGTEHSRQQQKRMNITAFRFATYALTVLFALLPGSRAAAKDSTMAAARSAAAEQQWDRAAMNARTALSRDPASVEALAILGEAELALGDTTLAITHLTRALSLEPKDPASLVLLTDVLLFRGAVDEADRFVTGAEAADRNGKLWEIKACRARVRAATGDVSTAIQMLAEAAAKNPATSLYPKLLARLYRDRTILPLAIDAYRQAIALEPGNAQLRFELAQVLLKSKQYAEAMEEFQAVRRADPDNSEVNFQVGRLYFAAGRYADALEPLQASAAERADHFYSHYLLGQTLRKLARPEEAEASLRAALALRPNDRDLQLLIAQSLFDEKKYEAEAGFLHTVLGDSSTDAELLLMEADAYFAVASATEEPAARALHLDSALVCYKQSLSARPDQARVAYRAATIYYNSDRPDSAIAYYQKTLAIEPEHCGANINMGYSYGRVKRWNDAIAALRRGIACNPDNVAAHAYLASILAAQDSTSAALDLYQRVVALDPAHGEAYGQMGLIYFNRENYPSAIQNLRQAVTYSPGNGDYWSLLGYANWSQFLKIRETIRDSHDGLIPGDELLSKGEAYLKDAERGFRNGLQHKPGDKDLTETLQAVEAYRKRLGGG